MQASSRRQIPAYVAAVALTAALLLLLRLQLPSGKGLLLFTIAVLAAAWYGGLWPGLFATTLGALVASIFLFEPIGSPAVAGQTDIVWLAMFAALGVAITAINEAAHRARRRDEARQRVLVRQAAELRDRDKHLVLALETARLGTWELDLEGRTVVCSHRCKANFGLEPDDELTYDGLLARVHDEDRDRVRASFERAIAECADFDAEFRVDGGENGTQWLIARGQVSCAADGRALRVTGVTLDVTAHRRAEQQVAAARAELQLVADSVPALISYIGTDGRYRLHNRAYERWFGWAPGEVNGRHVRDVLGEAAWETIRPHVELALSGQPTRYDSLITYRDGSDRWVSGTNTPDVGADGRVRGFVAHVIDITERKQAEAEQQRFERTLKEADRRKNDFLATLAHELRNPLAPLRNGLELLRLGAGDADAVRRCRDMMDRQLQQMVRLIDDLLDVSRISRNRLELRLERIELAAAVLSAVETLRPVIEASGVELDVRLPREPAYLHADLTRLAQVVSNLLSNAAKYTPRGGSIRLTAEAAAGEAVIKIADSGIGIPAEQLPHIFEMFAQVDSALERSQGGLGIGLALARALVEMHGGRIEARSDGPGAGSEFVVRLPALDAPADTGRADLPAAAAGQAAVTARRILVVDDYEEAAETLAVMLGLMGHETATAQDGVEALRTAQAFRPDVVLLDIGLPGLNGYEVARRIRVEDWGRKTVLVAVTGWGQDDDKRRADEAGFDVHLTKPVDPLVLQGLLAKWLPDGRRTWQAVPETSGA